MATGKNHFTYHPERNKILDGKRYSRRTTTVRPITFFKNWDSNLNTPENSKRWTSPLKDSLFVPETQKDGVDGEQLLTQDNEVLNETTNLSHHVRNTSVTSPILSVLSKEYPGNKTGSVARASVNNKLSQPDNENDLQGQSAVHTGEVSDETNHGRQNGGKNCESDSRHSNRIEECTDQEQPSDEKSQRNRKKGIVEVPDRSVDPATGNSQYSEEMDTSDSEGEDNTATQHQAAKSSSGQTRIVHYLQNAGLHVSVVDNERLEEAVSTGRAVGEKRALGKAAISGINVKERESRESNASMTGTIVNSKFNNSVRTEKSVKGKERVDDEEDEKRGASRNAEVDIREVTAMDMEEIDITHKIPLAQSTAIGVEIEQETEEEDSGNSQIEENRVSVHQTDASVNQRAEPENPKQKIIVSGNSKQQGENIPGETPSASVTPRRTSKRKLVTSTPKPEYSDKRRRVSVKSTVSVQKVNIQHQSVHTPEQLQLAQAEQNTRKRQKSGAVKEHTPDLRKAMLLSYAKTPSGVTPSYLVKTPKSGPVIRPPRKKRPEIIPVPDDLALTSPQRVEEVDLWQGDLEQRRHLSDTTDLDIVLQTFERVAWHYKENIEEPTIRKAVTLFAKKTQADLRKMSQSIINKKRVQLLSLQKEHSRLKASVAGVRLELADIETEAERQTDVLQFRQDMRAVQAEQAGQEGKKGTAKVIVGMMTKENTGLSGEYLNQAQKLVSRTVKSLKLKNKT